MPSFRLRRAVADDFDRYLDAFERVAEEGRWLGAQAPIDRAARRPFFDKCVAGDAAVLFLAEEAGGLVGAASASGTGAVDIGMFVAAGRRGGGTGAALLEAVIGWARAEQAHKVALAVWPSNHPAMALYSKFGFRVEGRRWRHYRRHSGELWDAVLMGLPLDETSPGGPGPDNGWPPPLPLTLPPGGIRAGDLTLRPWRMADVAPLVEAAADPLIAEWISEMPQPYSTEHAQAWVATATAGLTEHTAANLAVTLDGRLAGAVGLRFDPTDPHLATIGYWTAAPARRRRVATRAVRAISAWGVDTLGIRRIEIYAAADNLGSRGVAEAAGFEQEGVLRAWRVTLGKPTDFALYARVSCD